MITAFPTDIQYSNSKRLLTVTFDNGDIIHLTAERLRVESPSAEVQGHGPTTKQIVRGKETVQITRMEPVGTYAIRLVFDDGHDTGLYTWAYLRELAAEV
jgi:DUF971 family protein